MKGFGLPLSLMANEAYEPALPFASKVHILQFEVIFVSETAVADETTVSGIAKASMNSTTTH